MLLRWCETGRRLWPWQLDSLHLGFFFTNYQTLGRLSNAVLVQLWSIKEVIHQQNMRLCVQFSNNAVVVQPTHGSLPLSPWRLKRKVWNTEITIKELYEQTRTFPSEWWLTRANLCIKWNYSWTCVAYRLLWLFELLHWLLAKLVNNSSFFKEKRRGKPSGIIPYFQFFCNILYILHDVQGKLHYMNYII